MCVNLSHKSPITHSHTSNQQMLPYNRKKRKKKKPSQHITLTPSHFYHFPALVNMTGNFSLPTFCCIDCQHDYYP